MSKEAENQITVLELMDYAVRYSGNFIRSMRALTSALASRGARTILVFPVRASNREWIPDLAQAGLDVRFAPEGFFSRVWFIYNILRKEKVTVIHSHFINSAFYFPLACSRLLKPGVRHVFHAHSMPSFNTGSPFDFIRRVLLGAKIYVCVSSAVAGAYSKAYRKCITVINAVDFSRLKKVPVHEKENMNGTDEKKSLLMFGYSFPIKGIDMVLNTLEKYDTRHNYTLMICSARGVEDAAAQVRQTLGVIPDWVQLLPPRDDIAVHYAKADAFLSASRHEGFGYAVVEAAAMHLPLILSSIPAHLELAFPYAEFFEMDNKRALYEAISSAFLKKAEDIAKETMENAAYAHNQFSLGRWAAETADILVNANKIVEMNQ